MKTYIALLRGINLGQRTVKNADLRACYEAMGFANVKTLVASGNVIFDAAKPPDRAALEAGFSACFGFESGTVLRSQDQLWALIESDPFDGRSEDANTKLYVTFVADGDARTLPMPCEIEGDFKVMKLTASEACILAFRQDGGRFGLGMETIWKHYGKKRLWTSRNWNTVLKAAGSRS